MVDTPPNLLRRQILTTLTAIAGARVVNSRAAVREFPVFDALLHVGKPDLTHAGLQALPAVADIWRPGSDPMEVDPDGVRSALRRLPRGTQSFFIDIENWPLLGVSTDQKESSIDKLVTVARTARQAVRSIQFGFYGIAPATIYWPLVASRPAQRADWEDCNRRLDRLATNIDCSFPSLYTFYDDRRSWLAYASATIAAARRYGKPVYPFLWYEYHDSNPMLRHRDVDADAWREQLQFCRAHADGVVLWGGYRRQWSDRATWWRTVRDELGSAK